MGQANVRGSHTIYDSMGRVTETDRLDNLVLTVTANGNGDYTSQFTSSSLTPYGQKTRTALSCRKSGATIR